MNNIYYELAIMINSNLYEKNYITYKEYLNAENKIIKKIGQIQKNESK